MPRGRAAAADSVALEIARRYLQPDAVVHELTFPMTADAAVLRAELAGGGPAGARDAGRRRGLLLPHARRPAPLFHLHLSAPRVAGDGPGGEDRHRAGRHGHQRGGGPDELSHRPGQSNWSRSCRPPTTWSQFAAALDRGGTVVLMKIGRRLQQVLDELERRGLTRPGRVRLSRRHGAAADRNRSCRRLPEETGYLRPRADTSVIFPVFADGRNTGTREN